MAVATDDSVDEEPLKKSKIVSMSLLSEKVSDFPPTDAQQSTNSNHYEPEPRALAKVKASKTSETRETLPTEYCPMNGTQTSEYLQPISDWPGSGYLPMAPPPNYDSCVGQNPPVSYANEENEDPTIDTSCEPDCGLMGYDVPPPTHVYSEIPGNDNDDVVDEEGNHIYESLDQPQPQ